MGKLPIMEKEWTEQTLRELVQGARTAFEAVSLTELEPDEEAFEDDGLMVDYELRGGQVHCVMRRRLLADGRLWQVQMTAPLAGNVLPEDRMTAREREMCRSDMNHDFLTGVFNRRYLETAFCARLDSWVAAGRGAAVALVELDQFSALKQRHGQPTMDQVVCCVANQWKKHFDRPPEQVVCRLTGSIFVVGCADCTEKQLEEQMRALYAAMPRECVATVGMMCRVPYTLTAACAGTDEVADKRWNALYLLCDERLRAAEAAGGDRVFEV